MEVAAPRAVEVEQPQPPGSPRGRLFGLVLVELVEPVVELVVLQRVGLLVLQAEVGVLRLVAQAVLVLVRLDRGVEEELAAGPAVHVARPARLHEPLDGAVGLPARPRAEIDLARGEQEADRVTALHPEVQVLHFVYPGARRHDRHRCESGDRDADVVLRGGLEHRDPRLLAAADPLGVHASGDEHAALLHDHIGAVECKLAKPDTLPLRTDVDGAGEGLRRLARIDRAQYGRGVRPLDTDEQGEQERCCECESGPPDCHHLPFAPGADAVRINTLSEVRLYAATGDGIVRLDEAGDGWTVERFLDGSGAQCLAVDPRDPDTVFAGLRERGVRRTQDGGRSWADCALPEPGVFSIGGQRRRRRGLRRCRASRLFRSDDRGETWRELEALLELPVSAHLELPAPAVDVPCALDRSEPARRRSAPRRGSSSAG